MAYIFIRRTVFTKRYPMDETNNGKREKWENEKKCGTQAATTGRSLNGEWKKAMWYENRTQWEKDTKENWKKQLVLVEATGKARLFCTIGKYSGVDCLDVHMQLRFFKKK